MIEFINTDGTTTAKRNGRDQKHEAGGGRTSVSERSALFKTLCARACASGKSEPDAIVCLKNTDHGQGSVSVLQGLPVSHVFRLVKRWPIPKHRSAATTSLANTPCPIPVWLRFCLRSFEYWRRQNHGPWKAFSIAAVFRPETNSAGAGFNQFPFFNSYCIDERGT